MRRLSRWAHINIVVLKKRGRRVRVGDTTKEVEVRVMEGNSPAPRKADSL